MGGVQRPAERIGYPYGMPWVGRVSRTCVACSPRSHHGVPNACEIGGRGGRGDCIRKAPWAVSRRAVLLYTNSSYVLRAKRFAPSHMTLVRRIAHHVSYTVAGSTELPHLGSRRRAPSRSALRRSGRAPHGSQASTLHGRGGGAPAASGRGGGRGARDTRQT